MGAPYLGVTCGLTVALTSTVWPRVLDFLSPYNAEGVARMSDINLALPLPTTLVLLVRQRVVSVRFVVADRAGRPAAGSRFNGDSGSGAARQRAGVGMGTVA